MENPIKIDDLGGTPIFGNLHTIKIGEVVEGRASFPCGWSSWSLSGSKSCSSELQWYLLSETLKIFHSLARSWINEWISMANLQIFSYIFQKSSSRFQRSRLRSKSQHLLHQIVSADPAPPFRDGLLATWLRSDVSLWRVAVNQSCRAVKRYAPKITISLSSAYLILSLNLPWPSCTASAPWPLSKKCSRLHVHRRQECSIWTLSAAHLWGWSSAVGRLDTFAAQIRGTKAFLEPKCCWGQRPTSRVYWNDE